MQEKALIAMSGGVDSSVAALLTQQAGFTCIGATMQLHKKAVSDSDDGRCGSSDDVADARAVAHRLGMPFHVFDFTDPFRREVMDKFVTCYECGLTPNPCVDCNRHLKFGALLQQAKALGCIYLVTGHYARIRHDEASGRHLLYKATDPAKDQSYFLYALSQEQLAHIRFPLGELSKDTVRAIAAENDFINAKKRDSQDICFVPNGDYMDFLQRHTGKTYPAGAFLDQGGKVVGQHSGAVGYTLGQRKGLGLAMGEPVYVCAKDMAANTVTVGPESTLMHRQLVAKDWFFFPFDHPTAPLRVKAKTRSRMAEQEATLYPKEDGAVLVEFDSPQRAITPGQAVVAYDGDLVVGGGTITEVLF